MHACLFLALLRVNKIFYSSLNDENFSYSFYGVYLITIPYRPDNFYFHIFQLPFRYFRLGFYVPQPWFSCFHVLELPRLREASHSPETSYRVSNIHRPFFFPRFPKGFLVVHVVVKPLEYGTKMLF